MSDQPAGPVAGPSRLPFRLRVSGQAVSQPLHSATKVRKRPANLALVPPVPSKRGGPEVLGSRSVPASPVMGETDNRDAPRQTGHDGRDDLRDTLRGAPRRRPSVLFTVRAPPLPTLSIPPRTGVAAQETSWPSSGPPTVWQDPSEHILSGQGSSLQHARSSYASGPIEVLPGLYLGDEFNACDERALVRCGISTILNVAKETTLPCQEDDESRDLGFLCQSVNLSRGLERRLHLHDEAVTPTSAKPVHRGDYGQDKDRTGSPPATANTETFFTPVTSFPPILSPSTALSASSSSSQSRPPSFYFRNTSSTPNLNASFEFPCHGANDNNVNTLPGAYRSGNDSSDEEEGESAATSSLASHISSQTDDTLPPSPRDEHKLSPSDLSVTTPSSSTFSRRSPATANASMSSSSSAGSYTIALPENAVALSVPPSPQMGRTWPIRYIKLPWTHDETDLAAMSSTGGFVTGCAIIADALGFDLRNGQMTRPLNGHASNAPSTGRGGILVHCQCGVSRSATLVIAFVMQAAAYEYDFARTKNLTGMHDCYEMVKCLSSSISPNISLIYQLVEWERLLSSQASSHQGNQPGGASDVAPPSADPRNRSFERRWGKEVMDEEDWMRMRAEEERKERLEEEQREQRLREVRAREAEWRAAQAQPSSKVDGVSDAPNDPAALKPPNILGGPATGVGARRKKGSPSLTLLTSSKTNADKALGLTEGVVNRNATHSLLSEEDETDTAGRHEAEEDVVVDEDAGRSPLATCGHADPTTGLPVAQRPKNTVFPWLQNHVPSSRPNSRPGSGYGAAAFGAVGQSAAERRIKHKRTFSAEVPDWNARQAAMVRSKTDGSRLSMLAASGTTSGSSSDHSSASHGSSASHTPATGQ